jgi:hypothetical protein
MLCPDWSRFGSVGAYVHANSARRDVHKLCLIVLHSPRTGQTSSDDYIDANLARRYFHKLPHSSRIQPFRRAHFRHHTHGTRTDSLAHSSRRPHNTNRIPNHHPPRLDFHRTRRQAHAHRVRHTTRLSHHQHHQPPRRKQHRHKHRDHDLLRDSLIKLQRHAARSRLSAARNDYLRDELHHQDAADDLYRLCDLQRLHRYGHGFFQGLGRVWRLWISQQQSLWGLGGETLCLW